MAVAGSGRIGGRRSYLRGQPGHGRDGYESMQVLSELWWRAVYSKPG